MLGQQPGGQVQPAGGYCVADGVGVAGRDAADGVDGVVNGAERGFEVAGGGSEVGRVSGRADVGAIRGPAGIVEGEPTGPQDEVLDLGGGRGDVPAMVCAGADGVPVAGDRTPGWPCLAEGVAPRRLAARGWPG